ncbi:RNA-directed DNA polymerase, eukaryota [Tanacetum coccineum]
MASKFRGGSQYSNASLLERLSCNIFITNFPKQLSAKELWSTCAQYGTILDVYIPKKVSKQGKPLDFTCFNKVNDVDQLIKNLRSVWLGNFHLYANVAHFNRDTKPSPSLNLTPNVPLNASKPSFAKVVKDKGTQANHKVPVMVLEPGNLNYEGNQVLVGCVKDFKTLPNMHNVYSTEVILKGKVAVIHAKEVIGWVPDFGENKSSHYEEDSDNNSVDIQNWVDDVDNEVVPDSFQSNDCGDIHMEKNDLEKNYVESASEQRPKYPPGFTPLNSLHSKNEAEKVAQEISPPPAPKHVTKKQYVVHEVEESINNMGEAGDIEHEHNNVSSGGSKQDHFDSMARPSKPINGFSILERFQEFIDIGQAMGYVLLEVDQGTWLATNSDLLFMSVYSPQELSLKRVLWSYISGIFSRWHGEVVVMVDFNKVAILFHDLRLDKGNSLPDDLSNSANAIRELKIINQQASMDTAQNAKITWAIKGDENSKFFLVIVNKKQRHLAIKGIIVEGEWIDNPPRVKAELFNHFANRFSAPDWTRVPFDGQFPRCLDCGSDKSLDSDGFTFEFFKKFWSIVDGDVIKAVKEFFNSSIFPNGCNSSFIALIPKVLDAKHLNDFRPISLIGRQINDGPLILNEIISWCKYRKEQSLMFKVDFQKAFDLVRWDHLDDILRKLGFGDKWQGDPLSPFLFIPVMQSLHISFQRLIDRGLFTPILIGKDNMIPISHLFYVDDAMFIGTWSCSNVNALMMMLQWFFLASGLKVNVHKSCIYGVGVRLADIKDLADRYGCLANNLPFTYLCVKVGANMNRMDSWNDVVKKVKNMLSTWKAKTLSVGGRLTLIKSVLGTIPTYYMSLFKAPEGVLSHLEGLLVHGINGSLNSSFRSNSHGSVWIGMLKAIAKLKSKGINLLEFCKLVIGNGNSTKFWHDKWYDDIIFKEKIHRLYNLETQKDVSVAHKLQCHDLASSFRRPPRSARVWIDNHVLATSSSPTRWSKILPIKETLGNLTTGDCLSPKVKVFLIPVIGSGFALLTRRRRLLCSVPGQKKKQQVSQRIEGTKVLINGNSRNSYVASIEVKYCQ